MPDVTAKTACPTPDELIADKVFLITGGAGFIGSHVTDAIIALGGKVVIVDNLLTGRRENINPAAVFYEGNIADLQLIDQVFREHKPDYISLCSLCTCTQVDRKPFARYGLRMGIDQSSSVGKEIRDQKDHL